MLIKIDFLKKHLDLGSSQPDGPRTKHPTPKKGHWQISHLVQVDLQDQHSATMENIPPIFAQKFHWYFDHLLCFFFARRKTFLPSHILVGVVRYLWYIGPVEMRDRTFYGVKGHSSWSFYFLYVLRIVNSHIINYIRFNIFRDMK